MQLNQKKKNILNLLKNNYWDLKKNLTLSYNFIKKQNYSE